MDTTMMAHTQPQPFTGYGSGGTYHYAPSAVPEVNPAEQEWSFRVIRTMRERRAPVALLPRTCIQSAKIAALSERALWKEIQSFPAFSVREFILRAIAEGGYTPDRRIVGKDGLSKIVRGSAGLCLSQQDADSQVFGPGLNREERHRNYLRRDGTPFDQWIDYAIMEYDPASDGNVNHLHALHSEFSTELSDAIMRVTSSKEARTILVNEFRKAQTRSSVQDEPAF
jgi:hypothetical protein